MFHSLLLRCVAPYFLFVPSGKDLQGEPPTTALTDLLVYEPIPTPLDSQTTVKMAPSALVALGSWKEEKRVTSSRGINDGPETEALVSPPSPAVPDYDPTVGAKPYSPFYRHATQNFSAQTPNPTGTLKVPNANELENGVNAYRPSGESDNRRNSKLWTEKKRHCDWLRALPKKQRIAVKAVIAIAILGTMVAIALGITAAVGGGVWKSNHQQGSIGS